MKILIGREKRKILEDKIQEGEQGHVMIPVLSGIFIVYFYFYFISLLLCCLSWFYFNIFKKICIQYLVGLCHWNKIGYWINYKQYEWMT